MIDALGKTASWVNGAIALLRVKDSSKFYQKVSLASHNNFFEE